MDLKKVINRFLQLLVASASLLSSAQSSVHPPAISVLRKAALEPGHILPFLQFELTAANENREQTAQDVANVLAKLAEVRGPPVRVFRDPGDRFGPRHVAFGLDRWWRLPLERSIAAVVIVDAVEAARAHHILQILGVAHTVTPEIAKQTQYVPSDPSYVANQAAHYEAVGLHAAWALTGGDASIVIHVVDAGVDEAHPDLQLNKWRNKGETSCGDGVDNDGNGFVDDCHGYNHAEDTSDLIGSSYHGCHVAGLVGATTDNGIGVAGSAGGKAGDPGCSFMVSTVFGVSNNGGFAEAIVYGADNGASISSNSWAYSVPLVYDSAVLLAINYATENDVLVVFAAGNNGDSGRYYPAYYSYTVAVAATDNNGTKASYSNYGSHIDISAPGNNIYSTGLNGSYLSSSGTSFAAPVVSGALALARSYAPERSVAELKACLFSTATDIEAVNEETYSGMLGAGLLNVPALLTCVRSPTLAPSPAPSRFTLAPSLSPSWTPSLQPSFVPTPFLPTFNPSLPPTLPPTVTPSLMPSATVTATASVQFLLSATTAPTASQLSALKADVIAHSTPWEVQRFTVSSSSARRRLQDTSGQLRGYSGNSTGDDFITIYSKKGDGSSSNERQLSSVVWTATFDVVAETDSVSAAASSVTTALAEPAFSSAVATSTGATVDTASISVVVLTRKPSAAPSWQPTLLMPMAENMESVSTSNKSSATFDVVVLACTAAGGLLVAGALVLWRAKVASSKSNGNASSANQSASCNPTSKVLSFLPTIKFRALNPFVNKSGPTSSAPATVPEQSSVLNDVANDRSSKIASKHQSTIELSGTAKFRYPGGGSFKSDDTNPEQVTWALGEGGSEDYAGSDQAAVEELRARWQKRQWASHRATHGSSAGQQPAPGSRGSTVLGTALDTGERWHDGNESSTEMTSAGMASPVNAMQRRRASAPEYLAAPKSNCSQPAQRLPKRRASYNDASDARYDFVVPRSQRRLISRGGLRRSKSGSDSRLSGENSESLQVITANNERPSNQYRRDSRSANAPTSNAASTSKDPWMNDTRPSNQCRRDSRNTNGPVSYAAATPKDPWMNGTRSSIQNCRDSGPSSEQRYIDNDNDVDDVAFEAFPASEEAASLLFRARLLKAQDNLVDASIMFQRALALAEGSNSSNVGLSSVELAQAQFHLAGCLRRLSTRANEGTMSPEIPEDPKHRLNAALELYELCTTTMAQELAFINDEDENALQLAVDLASAYNDWGVGLWQRGNHGDAEAALSHFSRALRMRRNCRGEVRYNDSFKKAS